MKVTIDEQINEKKKETNGLKKKIDALHLFSMQLEESIKEMNQVE